MLLKPGVELSRLVRPVRRILSTLDRIFKRHSECLVITSTYEGNHSPSSLHYSNEAIDIRLPVVERINILKDIKDALGEDFDVVVEIDHIHIEHDPKK